MTFVNKCENCILMPESILNVTVIGSFILVNFYITVANQDPY